MSEMTLTEFRRTLFASVDKVLETGEPVVLNRNGRRLVLREEPATDAAENERAERIARWRRWFDQGPRPNFPDLSLEEINEASRDSWSWSEDWEPKSEA